MQPTDYSALETLRDGSQIEIRALRPEDRDDFMAAVGRVGEASLYRRFFGPKRKFSEREESFFITDVDFDTHVALIAVGFDGGKPVIMAGARYVVSAPGQAEVAFVVVDAYQGRGIGTRLLRHLAELAREAGLKELVAEVLPENTSMLKVFERSGMPCQIKRQSGLVHVSLSL